MKRMLSMGMAALLAACTPVAPEAAQPPDVKQDVLGLLAALAEAPPLDAALVERALRVKLAHRGSGATGTRSLAHGTLSASIFNGSATITMPGKLPGTPCVLSIGELLDQAEALGYAVNFYDLGSKPAWTLTKNGIGGRGVGMNIMTNPPTKPGERQACVGYISAGTEAFDEQAVP